MFGFLKSNPLKKMEKEYDTLLEQAMQFQRNGDMKSYAFKTEAAESLREKIDELKKQAS